MPGRRQPELIHDDDGSTPPRPAARRVSSAGPPRTLIGIERASSIAEAKLRDIDPAAVRAFTTRLSMFWDDLVAGWAGAYGRGRAARSDLERLIDVLAARHRDRRPVLRRLDEARAEARDWIQDPSMIGYVCYPAQFGGTLAGVGEHLDYLDELHVRYLHLMPLLRSREGEADGGYAVVDYRAVEPSLGTMDDLERLCDRLRERGISLCVDLVLNHTAAEHDWAIRARAGDPAAAAMYRIFPDRRMPDRYEVTLPETFPETAPGNFTELPDGRWVWTTFHPWQWDLDWSNPDVFVEMVDVLLELANRGVEVFRLDAVAFLWKRLGTDCQNEPEVHDLLQALRACARIVAPAVSFKAEAIVGPDDLRAYLGVGRHRGRVSDMAYHNGLMVQFWSALATRDARLMTMVLGGMAPKPPETTWAAYIRCHDDIGWAITDGDAAAVGWDGRSHRMFLSSFYSGESPGSFARGALFNFVPETGDSRVSGTFASLAGLEAALDDGEPARIDAAIERIRLGHALIMAWDGIPLLYMGDEIGLRNHGAFLDDPLRAADSRWLHRPPMDWIAVARRHDPMSVEGRIFGAVRRLVEARRDAPQLHAACPLEFLEGGDPAIFAFARTHPLGALIAIHNFADEPRTVPVGRWLPAPGNRVDLLDPGYASLDEMVVIPARGVRWVVAPSSAR